MDRIRVLVLSEIPATDQNVIWNLFSGHADRVQHAAQRYRSKKTEVSTVLNQVFESYQQEGLPMPYTIEDFMRDVTLEHLKLLPAEERLAGLSAEEIEAYLQKLRSESPKIDATPTGDVSTKGVTNG